MLNHHEGLRLYWAPSDIHAIRERLLWLGYSVSEIVNRDCGQTEVLVVDDDGYPHCFGVATREGAGDDRPGSGSGRQEADAIKHP